MAHGGVTFSLVPEVGAPRGFCPGFVRRVPCRPPREGSAYNEVIIAGSEETDERNRFFEGLITSGEPLRKLSGSIGYIT